MGTAGLEQSLMPSILLNLQRVTCMRHDQITLHKGLLNGTRFVTCGQTDGQTYCKCQASLCNISSQRHRRLRQENDKMARQPLTGHGRLYELPRSYSETPHSVRLLWTRDRPVAETSTWQYTTLTRDKYPCPRPDSNPQSQQVSGRRSTP